MARGAEMKFISVSEAALDSIQRMGEADKARIAELEALIQLIDDVAPIAVEVNSPWGFARQRISDVRVSTNVQPIAKSEN
jgi:hypothetical protein